MKRASDYNFDFKIGDEKTRLEHQKYIDEIMAVKRAKWKRQEDIACVVKNILFTPIILAANLLSMLTKGCGTLLAFGLPYGIYCAYKAVMQLRSGVAISEISGTKSIIWFLLMPFVAFAVSALLEKFADWLDMEKDFRWFR